MEVDFNLQSERWPEGNGRGFCGAAGWMPVRLDHGFTLTGLAVVLACLSLIGFMLLPALIRAKDKQAIQVDLGNLRQLVQASQLYTADFRGYEPAPGWGTTADSWLYAAKLPPGGQGVISLAQIAQTNQLPFLRKSQLWPYVKNPRVFKCPSDSTNTVLWAQRNILIASYGMNGAICGYGGVGDGLSFPASLFASDRVQIWEIEESQPFSFNDASSYPYEGITGRHRNFPGDVQFSPTRGSGALGNFDGSAEVISTRAFYLMSGQTLPSASAAPNRLWCNPASPNGG